jgi:tetratricopeptide (TPR) repeat protein
LDGHTGGQDNADAGASEDLKCLLAAPGLPPDLIAISAEERYTAVVKFAAVSWPLEDGAEQPDEEQQARWAVRMAPDDPMAHARLGAVLARWDKGRFDAAAWHFGKALELAAPFRDHALLFELAWCMRHRGRPARARALFAEAIEAAKDRANYLVALAQLEEATGKPAAALELLDRAEALRPNEGMTTLARATALARIGDTEAGVALLEGFTTGCAELDSRALLERGRLLDKLGRYDEAWRAFEDGKAGLRAAGWSYDAAEARRYVARLSLFFTAGRMAALPRAGVRSDVAQPLFVLGFPRSGTTLVQRVLTSHPLITAGEDLRTIHDTAEAAPRLLGSPLAYPEALAEVWLGDHQDGLERLRDHYLSDRAMLGAAAGDARWIVEHMPTSEVDLGLMTLLFPHSPIIRMVRHPLDTILSVFSLPLPMGGMFSSVLESAARHFVLLADLADDLLGRFDHRCLTVRYEDLVGSHEATGRRVLGFIGEEFDAACLEHHANGHFTRTLSYAQVAEPLHDRARYRYRNYLRHLEPVLPILAPVMERWGYVV